MRATMSGLQGSRLQGVAGSARDEQLRVLRDQVERVQGRRLHAPPLPTHPAFSPLFPGGGLVPGSSYTVAPSASLLWALLSRPSQEGVWCAVVGMPDLGIEAAERYGVDLARVVIVPDAGPRWVAVAATLAEVVPIVAVRPPSRVTDADVARLSARLRDRDAVLLVQGAWSQAEASIAIEEPRWSGVGAGHGYLSGRELTVAVSSRRWPRPRRARVLLPAVDGGIRIVEEHRTPMPRPRLASVVSSDDAAPATVRPMRAVG